MQKLTHSYPGIILTIQFGDQREERVDYQLDYSIMGLGPLVIHMEKKSKRFYTTLSIKIKFKWFQSLKWSWEDCRVGSTSKIFTLAYSIWYNYRNSAIYWSLTTSRGSLEWLKKNAVNLSQFQLWSQQQVLILHPQPCGRQLCTCSHSSLHTTGRSQGMQWGPCPPKTGDLCSYCWLLLLITKVQT